MADISELRICKNCREPEFYSQHGWTTNKTGEVPPRCNFELLYEPTPSKSKEVCEHSGPDEVVKCLTEPQEEKCLKCNSELHEGNCVNCYVGSTSTEPKEVISDETVIKQCIYAHTEVGCRGDRNGDVCNSVLIGDVLEPYRTQLLKYAEVAKKAKAWDELKRGLKTAPVAPVMLGDYNLWNEAFYLVLENMSELEGEQ